MSNQALHFVGNSAQYADRPTSDGGLWDLPTSAGAKTIVFRLNAASDSAAQVLLANSGVTGGWHFRYAAGGEVVFVNDGDSAAINVGNASPGTEHMVAITATWTGSSTSIVPYFDGAAISATGVAYSAPSPSAPITVGRYPVVSGSSTPTSGDIWELALFDIALSTDQIASLWGGGFADSAVKFQPNLLAYYSMANGDVLDYSDGLPSGTGPYPLTNHGPTAFEAASSTVFGLPAVSNQSLPDFNWSTYEMGDFPLNSSVRVTCALASSSGTPITGVVYSTPTVTLYRADGTEESVTLTSLNWIELTSGAFSGTGTYDVILPASATTVLGLVKFAVSSAGAVTYRGSLNVVTPFFGFTGGGTTTKPTVTQVKTPYSTQMLVTFSTGMEMDATFAGALNIANYVCPGLTLSNPVEISSSVVMITTSTQVPGDLYILSVSNVQDLNGNVI